MEEYQLGDYYIDKLQLAQQIGGGLKAKFGVGGRGYSQCRQLSHHRKSGYRPAGKIIFRKVDATGPNRTYDDAERLNAPAFSIWIRPAVKCWNWTVQITGNSGRYMDQDTVKALEWFRELMKDRSIEDSRTFAVFAAQVLDDKKGFDIVVLDVWQPVYVRRLSSSPQADQNNRSTRWRRRWKTDPAKKRTLCQTHRRQKMVPAGFSWITATWSSISWWNPCGRNTIWKDLVRLRAD